MLQENNNYCLVSVISDIFSLDGIKKSQDEIAKNLTSDKKGFRADDKKIKYFMNNLGYDYEFYWWNETPLGEPDSLLKDICYHDGFVGIGNHAYRVLEFEDPRVVLLDPANESPRDFNYRDLMSHLREYDGGFGLVKKLNSF